MNVDVYPTDADAVDAAAALVAECLRAAANGGRATAALGGGRPGRAPLVALAGRGDLPWARVDWFLTDERCAPATDALATARIARDSLFGPRGVQAARIHGPAPGGGAPDAIASARWIGARSARTGLVLGVVVLGQGRRARASARTSTHAAVAVVPPSGESEPAGSR